MSAYLNYRTAAENNRSSSEVGASDRKTATLGVGSTPPRQRTIRLDGAGVTMQMQNIPTDLLRTLIAVVDLRSFTKAAQMLGVTQPAVSAQIKRLQSLIGYELLDKSAPGVSLTQRGETVVAQARRLLAINDEILQVNNGHSAVQTLRVGIPGDYSGSRIPATLARFRLRWPDIGFTVTSGTSDNMLRALKQGDLDVVMAVTDTPPVIEPRHVWMRQAVWVRSDATRVDPECAGAAGVLRRGLRLPARRGRGAEPGRPPVRLRLHVGQPDQPRGGGQRRLRRAGDAARPRAAETISTSGKTRRCRRCRNCSAASMSATAKPAAPPTSSRIISMRTCGRSRSRRTTRPAPPISQLRAGGL